MADEFDLIKKYFAPLSNANPSARGLLDDAALIDGLVMSADMLVENVHFLADSPLDLVACKAVRSNISDIIAKGATPFGYFLSLAWPKKTTVQQIEQFAEGLARDGAGFGLDLLGGDTVRQRNNGPLTIAITMLGRAGKRMPGRDGAKAGDRLYVSGTIGDGWLGLQIIRNQITLPEQAAHYLRDYYYQPAVNMALAPLIAAYASASLDISDGLLADAGHLARGSALDVVIEIDQFPLSDAAQQWYQTQTDRAQALLSLMGGGDDYQCLFTVASGAAEDKMHAAAQKTGVPVQKIGFLEKATQQPQIWLLKENGKRSPAPLSGYNHFA